MRADPARLKFNYACRLEPSQIPENFERPGTLTLSHSLVTRKFPDTKLQNNILIFIDSDWPCGMYNLWDLLQIKLRLYNL